MSTQQKFLAAVLATGGLAILAFVVIRESREGLAVPKPGAAVDDGTAEAAGTAVPGGAANKPAEDVATLYARNCAACHGEKGDGRGIAAPFLDPKPRHFGSGFRLVTSSGQPVNPSLEDIEAVLVRGMPGSSMVSWNHLSPAERRALAEHVLALRRANVRERRLAVAEEEGEDLTPEDLDDVVATALSLGPPLPVPDMGASTPERIAHGREVFLAKGCAACHGNDGKGGGVEKMLTSDGYPQRPRDLTLGIYKGTPDAQALYRRIRLGLPGSAMPSTPASAVPDPDVADLIHFVRSLSDEPTREQWVLRRRRIVAKTVRDLDEDPTSAAWQQCEPAAVGVAKLWWENSFRDPGLEVRAQHDGRRLAIRLNWKDDSQNDRAFHVDEFEDMAAVQLFRGSAEPFLGMGSKDSTLDLWHWRAGWGQPYPAALANMDEYPFQNKVASFSDKDGPPPDFLTARAAGNLNTNADRALAASNLAARGLGTTTFRPKASQIVSAKARYQDGGWSVVLTRDLEPKPDDGLALSVGKPASIAFALWNGAARDRNGQKAITIWHDLIVER